MALSAMAKQSVSKVSAKASEDGISVSYTLSENWDFNDAYECETCYYAYCELFANKEDAAAFFKNGSVYPIDEWILDDEYLRKGKHSFFIDYYSRDVWREYPNAVVAICVVDACSGPYAEGRTAVDFSAVSGASQEALRIYKKAQTLTGYGAANGGYVSGTVAFKLGAIDKKKGTLKVSATYTSFAGGKMTSVSQTVAPDDDGHIYGSLTFKLKSMSMFVDFEVSPVDDGLEFYAEDAEGGLLLMESARLGGNIGVDTLCFYNEQYFDYPDDDYEWLEDLFPNGVKISVTKGTKWSLPKEPSIKYKKIKDDDGNVEYVLTGLDDKEKTNVSGLKLTYTAKTGLFKGSYKIYASNEYTVDEGKAPKLKKYTVNVSGVMFEEGGGIGIATVKIGGEMYSWDVFINTL